MSIKPEIAKEICGHIEVPRHILVCAAMIKYDLLHGPSWVRIPALGIEHITSDDHATLRNDLEEDLQEGDDLEQCYTSQVAEELRAFLRELPSPLYIDDCGNIMETEPEGAWEDIGAVAEFEEDDGTEPGRFKVEGERLLEWLPAGEYSVVEDSQIVEALFGNTIAKHFDW